jgi:coenzyme PQQ synthesis protein D (PqqD)
MAAITGLRVASPQCVADDFGGEIVAINLNTGIYFNLRDLAAATWRDLAAGHPTDTVVEAVAQHDPQLAAEVASFAQRLVADGLMEDCYHAETPAAPLTVREAIAIGAVALAVDSYDDMQDLVLADPIHDVEEEAGWPVRRAE